MLDAVAALLGLLVVLPVLPAEPFADPLAAPLPLAVELLVFVDVLEVGLLGALLGVALWGTAID